MKSFFKFGARISHSRWVPLVMAGSLLNSCVPTAIQTPPASAAVPSIHADHWTKVTSKPPTWYPRDVPADCPTDFRSGEWISTGDAHGTRFFIPVQGIPTGKRQDLLHEALAFRSEQQRREIRDEAKENLKTAGIAVALMPVAVPGILAAEVIGTFVPWIYEPAWIKNAKNVRHRE